MSNQQRYPLGSHYITQYPTALVIKSHPSSLAQYVPRLFDTILLWFHKDARCLQSVFSRWGSDIFMPLRLAFRESRSLLNSDFTLFHSGEYLKRVHKFSRLSTLSMRSSGIEIQPLRRFSMWKWWTFVKFAVKNVAYTDCLSGLSGPKELFYFIRYIGCWQRRG